MTKVYLLLFSIFILTHSCSYLYNNTIFLTGTLQEVINVPLSTIFHVNNFERITLKQTNKFLTIKSPISKFQETVIGGFKNAKTLSQKLQKTIKSRDPINHLTILVELNGEYYEESNIGTYLTIPQITSLSNFSSKQKSICYDIIFIDKLSIVECDDESKNSYFIIKHQMNTQYLDIDKPISDFRKLDQLDNYMFRGTGNMISMYIEEDMELNFVNSLDETKLKALLKKDSFKLSIADFQIHTNGQLSIMNNFGEIIIVEYTNNQWQLIKVIETDLNPISAYDYDIYTNSYVIISLNIILYYNGESLQQILEIQNQNTSDKVYITKKNILRLKNNNIILYNKKLENLYNLKLDEEQNYINTNPHAEGFLIIGDTKIAAYTINNQYSLQLSLESTIDQDYLKASLLQEGYPKNCEITIFYKTQDFGYQKIFQSQYSQGLISGGINSDSDIIKIIPIFQGSNLKYQFKTNSLIKIQVENYQSIQFADLSDTKNLSYQKILTGKGQFSFYLIQQYNNLQVKAYACEGILQISCQMLFDKDTFIKLENSTQQLWWSNEGSLFFTIFEEMNIIIHYWSNETKTFQVLTNINLESNIKQIVTDGYHLFVLTQEKINVYQITIQDKAKLIMTFDVNANKIYASENVRNLLFIEQGVSLDLYNIEYNLQTLIWYNAIQIDNLESNLAIFANHFVRFTKTINQDEYLVTVFNYANKRNIYVEKQLQFSYYSDILLSTLDYSFDNNLFYVHGYNKQMSKQVILVYKCVSSSLDALFHLIDTTPTSQFTVANNYILITDVTKDNTILENYYINGELQVTTKRNQNYEQISYTLQINLDFEVTNDLSNKLVESIPINVVNRGQNIIKINDKINLKYFEDNNQTHCVNLGQDWYSGQVFDITIEDSSQKVKFKPSLTIQEEKVEFSPQIQQLNNDTLVQLMPNKLTLIKKEDFSLNEFTLEDSYKFTTILLIVGENIYVQAETQFSQWLRIIECKEYKNCKLLDTKLEFEQSIKTLYLHQNNFFCYLGNYIKVYDTQGQPTNLEQFQLFQMFQQYYLIKQMEFIYLKDDVYSFISVDTQGNLEFQMREISRTSLNNQFVRFQIDQIIAEQKINLQEIQISAGFVLSKNEITIIFTNSASYSFYYEIDCTRNKLCEIAKFQFNGLYQQYKDWELKSFYASSNQNENILQLLYFAKTHYELLIYDMETSSNNQRPKNVIARLASTEFEQQYKVQSFVYTYNGQLKLLTSIQDKNILQLYSLLRSHQLCIDESSVNEVMKFTLSNTDKQINIEEQVTIDLFKPIPPDEKNSFPIWAIILIILGVLLIGAGLYKYCSQRKNRKQNDNNLLLAQ
ncbi:unnamed protein product [Paramecium sonneborni]|uniref:Transmembrane protein n=1 Tax=Paramecium sonneborni TaxID=65129 RepID=A0A8S1QZT2_9CILI|nr:unnamed protein product [Paramecium sonneborni]